MTGSDGRGVSTVVATVLMAAIVVIIASSIGVTVFDVGSALEEPQEPRAFGDAEVTLGPEHREWSGWNSRVSDPPRGDIDVISLRYIAGSTFEGDDIGSVLIRWEGSEGEGGQVRFLNPNLFDEDSEQRFHSQDVGEFCTGDLGVGETLTVRMVHNRYQSSGDTGTSGPPFRYVESYENDISRGNDEPFFRVDNRYPIEYTGDRPMEPGDSVEILFIGVNEEQPIAQTTAVATAATGEPTERVDPGCD